MRFGLFFFFAIGFGNVRGSCILGNIVQKDERGLSERRANTVADRVSRAVIIL